MSPQGEGWYADPQDARRLRWWDGQEWTQHTHDAVAPGAQRRPLGVGWTTLAVWVQVTLALTIPTSIGVVLVSRQHLDVWRRIVDDPMSVTQAEAEATDTMVVFSLLEVPMLLACGVLFIVWLYQAHRCDRMDPSWQKRSSGWAIGSWFVPIVNLWFPFQVVSDLRRGARGDAREPSEALQWFWWIGFVLYFLSSRAASRAYLSASVVPDEDIDGYVDELTTAVNLELAAEVFSVVTAVLAIVMVRQLTAWVRTSSPVLPQRTP
jgi:hypothetical protein